MSLTKRNHVETPEEAKAKYRRFCSRLNIWLLKHDTKIDDIDLIFFPIHDVDHYYVVCFNIKNPSIEIIDNNRIADGSNAVYDGLPECLQQHFVSYLETSSPAKSKQLGSVSIVRLDMKWRTMYNKVDSGVFAINHMETYKGNGLRNWECKFAYEKGVQQKKQLEKACQIYASKIIYSPINLYKNKMVNEIKSLCQPR
ncbi:uncharacterized protein LOC135150490 [Daucus carota subsp. sativus]|uniref:uncharacterized protein LOC135150490 n=1 Tax=Daucus carota subsp. sativus TaxID=79200 RepID=UPI0030827CFB